MGVLVRFTFGQMFRIEVFYRNRNNATNFRRKTGPEWEWLSRTAFSRTLIGQPREVSVPKIPKFHSGKFLFHSTPHPEFLVEWKAPWDSGFQSCCHHCYNTTITFRAFHWTKHVTWYNIRQPQSPDFCPREKQTKNVIVLGLSFVIQSHFNKI